MNQDQKSFCDRLKKLRAGRTLDSVASALGMPISTLQRYENIRIPDADIAYKIAKFYGVNVEFLVTGEEQEPVMLDGGREWDVVKVPILEDRIAAGPGSEIDTNRVEEWAELSRWRLRRRGDYCLLQIGRAHV